MKFIFNGFFTLFILLTALAVSAQTEGIDAGFNPVLTKNEVRAGSVALAEQPDGKIIVSGDFDKVNGIARNRIARLNADGSVDTNFNPGSGFDVAPTTLVVQADGKILAGGSFTTYNGAARANLIRLNADGTIDTGFTATTNQSVNAFALQPDGKIVIGGSFTTVNGAARPPIARLNADGTTDTGFTIFGTMAGTVNTIVRQSNGRIIFGGSYSLGGFPANINRVENNGEWDSFFTAGNIPPIKSIILLPDDSRLLVITENSLRRLFGFGFNDDSFPTVTVTGTLNTFVRQANGNIILGGAFTAVNGSPRSNLARLRPSGRLEQAYVPSGTNGEVKALIAQLDGRTLVGGNFTLIGGVERSGLARVNFTPAVGGTTYFDFDGDGKADIAIYRQNEGGWYVLLSNSGMVHAQAAGTNTDIPVAADYNGDGRTDIAVWRSSPERGVYFIFFAPSWSAGTATFGKAGDDPSMVGDWNGDGRDERAVYREGATAGAQSFFFSQAPTTADYITYYWGVAGDRPVRGDFDGDGKLDPTVFRPSNGTWHIFNSASNTYTAAQFGVATDRTVAADYDGDGRTDIAVYRPSEGNWYRLNSSNGQFIGAHFGVSEDKPVPADYDGDGKADLAVYRPSDGVWYQFRSTSGFFAMRFGGEPSDIPIPYAFVH